MQYDNRLLVDSVHLEFGQLQVLQSAFITAQTGRVTGVLGRNVPDTELRGGILHIGRALLECGP